MGYFRAVKERDQAEVLHVWKRYPLDELPYTFILVFLMEKHVRTIAPVLFFLFILGFIECLNDHKCFYSLIAMLASLYTVVNMVSLVEISSYVNSRPDMKSIKVRLST